MVYTTFELKTKSMPMAGGWSGLFKRIKLHVFNKCDIVNQFGTDLD